MPEYERLPVCDRNLDPDIGHGIAIMLDRYCEWLNAWLAAEPWATDHRYNPTQFLDSAPDKSLYGSCFIDAMYDSTYHHVVALTIYDGDDGGATSLTGWWDDSTRWDGVRSTVLEHMTQEFDTYLQVIQHDGNFINTPDSPRPEETP